MTRRSSQASIKLFAWGLMVLWGCAPAVNRGAREDHGEQEQRITAEELAREWIQSGTWRTSERWSVATPATRVGLMLVLGAAAEMPRLEVRGFDATGTPNRWISLETTFQEEDHFVAIANLEETAYAIQVRIESRAHELLDHLRILATTPEQPQTRDVATSENEPGRTSEALRTELTGIGVISRTTWGARSTRCTGGDSGKYRMTVHHTVTPSRNPGRQMRTIQAYHMDANGWCDVGYHFLVGIDGTVYEGRPLTIRGAHVAYQNSGNIGVAFVGCFQSDGCRAGWGPQVPPDLMLRAGGELLGTLATMHGITVSRTTLKGHRDYGGYSACPGANLHARLEELRRIARGTRTPASPVPSIPPLGSADSGRDSGRGTPGASSSSRGECTHRYGGRFGNLACSAAYQCCDGGWQTRGTCGGCTCVETSGESGCGVSMGGGGGDLSCTHSYGGIYAHQGCSASYQCCDGLWRSRGSCGSCACTESSGERGCVGRASGSDSTATGADCRHGFGGIYGNQACSASYQCCDGNWRGRGACGACTCSETTGERGCGATGDAPSGASCTHRYGGIYADGGCSASYQCCDGNWRSRGACGACTCSETTGERGCTDSDSTPSTM